MPRNDSARCDSARSDRARTDAELAALLTAGAGEIALRHQLVLRSSGALGAQVKTNPTDLVTAADREAEEFILGTLATERPADGVLGEEGAFRASTSGRTWVIDPVDGTYNFVRGSDRWCVALALTQDEAPVLGAIAQPATGRLAIGGPGVGVRHDDVPAAPVRDVPIAEANLLTYLHPPHHGTEVGETWRRLVADVATLRMTGSGSLDAVDVAAGRADLVVQHSVPSWDRLPGEALIRGVGGHSVCVVAAGVEWYVAGVPRAVDAAVARLRQP